MSTATKKLKTLLKAKDNERARIALVSVEVNGKPARAERIGQVEEVVSINADRIYLISGRYIHTPKAELVQMESENTFSVSRDCGNGVTEKRTYQIEHSPHGIHNMEENEEGAPDVAQPAPATQKVGTPTGDVVQKHPETPHQRENQKAFDGPAGEGTKNQKK